VKEIIQTLPQYLLPQHAYSRLIGRLSNCRQAWVKDWCIQTFIKRYGVDLNQSINNDAKSYPDFNSFFTRPIRPELRPIIAGHTTIACPADGSISQLGAIQAGRIFQAKGFDFDLHGLLGGNAEQAALFKEGQFITLYLAPKDYHRVHMPLSGELRAMTYIPGRLFSVNPRTVRTVPALFARNERVVCFFETNAGPMAVIMIGAMLVASINTVWAGEVTPKGQRKITSWQYPAGEVVLAKGAELGHFKLGSTVMVLFGGERITWDASLHENHIVQMGQLLANVNEQLSTNVLNG
jgi:phosphatidylserine decarboxylase